MITALLAKVFGRLPIGWLQLRHNLTRLVTAVGGVTFANVLIFMQLGFMNALFETSVMTHRMLDAEVIVASSDFRSMREANPMPRSRAWQAMTIEGVEDVIPMYLGQMFWTNPLTDDTTQFRVIGVDPDQQVFTVPKLQAQLSQLREPDTALVDRKTRDFDPEIEQQLAKGERLEIEMSGRRLTLIGMFAQGASFADDGSLIVSDQTFLRLFPQRKPGTPTLLLLKTDPSWKPETLAATINQQFPEADAKAFSKSAFIDAEQSYQARQTPIGFVFGFGVAIGLVVGLVIVYQVLSTDVQDHLSEYATFKAMGYAPRFFLSVVFEEALCLAALGFIPGFLITNVLYVIAAKVTSLPIEMPWSRPLFVFVLTAVMCTASGAIATRRLNSADPADLF
ncbi:DevC ABC transport system permease [Planctomycetales bacterium 10988]|nr:DevC ABC transport system permease [Planctomycetales bacterium 10988]